MDPRFSLGLLPKTPDSRDFVYQTPRKILAALPAYQDLSVGMPAPYNPPLDQSSLGVCGPTTLAKAILWVDLKDNEPPDVPSRLAMYYWTRLMMGTVNEDSGVDNRTMLKALGRYGWPDETLCPFNISRFRQAPSQEAVDQAAKRTAGISYAVVQQTLNEMKGCLASTGKPWIFGFSLSQSVYDAMTQGLGASTGIIPMPTQQEQMAGQAAIIGGHDILCDGYSDIDRPGVIPGNRWPAGHFKCQNHWYISPEHPMGDGGYYYVPYEYATNRYWSGDFWTVEAAPQIISPNPQPQPEPPMPNPPSPSPLPIDPAIIKWMVDAIFSALEKQYAGRHIILALLQRVQALIDSYLTTQHPQLNMMVSNVSLNGLPFLEMSKVRAILIWIEMMIKEIGPKALPIVEGYLAYLGLSPAAIAIIDAAIQEFLKNWNPSEA